MYLMSIVTGAVVLSWLLIAVTHLQFRKYCEKVGHVTKFPSLLYPIADYISIIFLAGILITMVTIEEMRLAVIILPLWIVLIFIGYKYKKSK